MNIWELRRNFFLLIVVLCVAHTAKSQVWTKKTDFINGESARCEHDVRV